MLSYIKNLYNLGENDGDVKIFTRDNKVIMCHSFILNRVSENFKSLVNDDKTLMINQDKKIIDIVLNFSYCEQIIERQLFLDDILNVFSLINHLKMNSFILDLKSHYIRRFPETLSLSNWKHTLRTIFNIEMYSELFQPMRYFIKNVVFMDENYDINTDIDLFDTEIQKFLLSLSFETIKDLRESYHRLIDERENDLKEKMNRKLINEDLIEDDYEDIDSLEGSSDDQNGDISNKKKRKKIKSCTRKK